MKFVSSILIAATFVSQAHAADRYVIRADPSLTCLMTPPPANARQPGPGVTPDWHALSVFRAAPNQSAEAIGLASAIVFGINPPHIVNGFQEVRTYRGDAAWLPAAGLKPWRSALDPNAKCVPSLFSDGTLGIASR